MVGKGGGGVALARLAGKAAARKSYKPPKEPVTDNVALDRKNLKRVGFQGAEILRQDRLSQAAARRFAVQQILSPSRGSQIKAIPKGYDTSALGAFKRGQQAGVIPKNALIVPQDPISAYTKNPKFGTPFGGTVGTPFMYALSGAVLAAPHPLRAAKAILADYTRAVRHPIRYAKTEPEMAALNAWAGGSLAAGASLRAARAGAAAGSTRAAVALDKLGVTPATSVRQGLLQPPLARPPLRIFDDGSQGLYSRNALRFGLQRARDRATGNRTTLINDAGVNARMTEPVREAVFGTGVTPAQRTGSIGRAALGYLNKAQALAYFGLRPAFIPANMVGQEILLGMEGNVPLASTAGTRKHMAELAAQDPRIAAGFQAAVSPASIGSAFQQPRFDPAQNAILERLGRTNPKLARALGRVGKGLDKTLLSPLDTGTDIFSNYVVQRLIDRPQRLTALRKEFDRQGIKGAGAQGKAIQQLARYLELKRNGRLPPGYHGSPEVQRAVDVIRRANMSMVDYGGLSKFENALKSALFIYPFTRGATKYAARYPLEHPAGAALWGELGQEAYTQTKKDLGNIPSIAEGSVKVGERDVPGLGRVPLLLNPAAASILGSGPQFAGQLANFFNPHPSGEQASQLSQNFSPSLSAFLSGVMGIDIETGRRLDQAGFFEGARQLYRSTPQYRAWQRGALRALGVPTGGGNIDPRNVLYPYSGEDALGRYGALGQAWPVPYNPVKGTQLARAEQASGKSKGEQNRLRGEAFIEDALSKSAALGFNVPQGQLRSAVETYVALRDVQGQIKKEHAGDARYVTQQGTLTKDAVKLSRLMAAQRLGVPYSQIQDNLHALGRFAQLANTASTVKKLPYAEGGSPLPVLNR